MNSINNLAAQTYDTDKTGNKMGRDQNSLITGYILAAGRSSRLPKQHKGLQLLRQKPLIAHVIERFAPQVNHLYINSHVADYAQFDYPLLADQNGLFNGPLNGLLSCMQHALKHHPNIEWLAITPCDAPFLPSDMVSQLANAQTSAMARCYATQETLQPTFSLWNVQLLNTLTEAVSKQQLGGFKAFIHLLQQQDDRLFYPLDWPVEESSQSINPSLPAFFNINTPADLLEAENRLIQHEQGKLNANKA